jgi:subtilisin family serine protease
MKSLCIFIFLIIFIVSCNSIKEARISSTISSDKINASALALQNWFQKDYQQDAVPAISLDKFYTQNKKKSKSKSVIVAVIDTQIDIHHEDLKDQLWINTKEIPKNGIDDDHNGYVDDINGWNFLGTPSGDHVIWANLEYTRLVRDWAPLFKNKTELQISVQELSNYKEYHRALTKLEEEAIYYKNWLKSLNYSVVTYPAAKDSLKHYFPKEEYTYQQLDSMYQKYKVNDKTFRKRREDGDMDLGAMIGFMKARFDFNEKSLADVKENETQIDSIVNKNLNINFNERTAIGDDPSVLEKGYGNNNISIIKVGHRPIQNHATKVSGIIAANRTNTIGIKGIAENVKIMPLNISSSGDEHDKDITMAIRYAVDNGAKVINMSFGKEFSLHKKWVIEAYKYAEKHDVLLVHGSGNNSFNIDENPYYPNDVDYENPDEVVDNFINVGATTAKADSTFVASYSNYGKKNVDLFAPGDKIYTTTAGNSYTYDSGTSLAGPMVSGTAALIWSYYPKLSVQEIKQIILESGTAYDMEVLIPGGEGKKAKFSELSKSGQVLNVYDAMQLAKKVSKKKR